MKLPVILPLLAVAALLSGCATTTTVEQRKQERYGAYSQLSPEDRALLDGGRIRVGLGMDAVYIAWGKPSQVASSEGSQGAVTTWFYHGTYLQEYHYWSHGPGYYCGPYGRPYYYPPTLRYDYYPRHYVRATVNFTNGLVRDWQTLPGPAR
jgi:uncharacterized protein YceK